MHLPRQSALTAEYSRAERFRGKVIGDFLLSIHVVAPALCRPDTASATCQIDR
jgi:hypothetical protein